MPLTAEQRDRLQSYIDRGDRSVEPVFVGRADLFAQLERNARAAARGNCEGRTMCFSGPPGIGKTAFIREAGRRGADADPPQLHVPIFSDELRHPASVLRAIHAAVRERYPPARKAWQERLKEMLPEKLTLGIPKVLGGEIRLRASEPPKGSQAGFPWHAAGKLLAGVVEAGAVVVLAVDEAQSLSNTLGESSNVLLRQLHQGNRELPVFAMLLGHAQTPQVLAPSISHRYAIGNEQPMQPLTGDDSRDYAVRTLEWFRSGKTESSASGASPADRRLAHWIDGECGGWPHHLRNAMAAIAAEHARLDSLRLADLDGRRIASEVSGRRAVYYEDRLRSAAFAGLHDVIGRILGDLRGGRNRQGLIDAAAGRLREAGDAKWREHGTPEKAAKMLVEGGNGMLEKGLVGRARVDGRDVYVCPIANLRRFVQSGEHRVEQPFPALGEDAPATA